MGIVRTHSLTRVSHSTLRRLSTGPQDQTISWQSQAPTMQRRPQAKAVSSPHGAWSDHFKRRAKFETLGGPEARIGGGVGAKRIQCQAIAIEYAILTIASLRDGKVRGTHATHKLHTAGRSSDTQNSSPASAYPASHDHQGTPRRHQVVLH